MKPRHIALLFVGIHAAATAAALSTLSEARTSLLLPIVFGDNGRVVVIAVGVVCVLGIVETLRAGWRLRRGQVDAAAGLQLFGLLMAAIACLAVTTVVLELQKPIGAHIVASYAYGLFVVWTWMLPVMQRRVPRLLRRTAFVMAVNVVLALVLAEVSLRAASMVWPNPILATASSPDHIRRVADRERPGTLRFGFPVNSGGHYDSEFVPRDELLGPLVASIGDSFAYGIVPHALNFTSVAEQQLPGVHIHNMGFPGIGANDYRYLLEHEALRLNPDLILIHLFVGNDLHDGKSIEKTPSWFTADSYMTSTVWQRLSVLRRELKLNLTRTAEEAATTLEEMFTLRPFLADPLLETPRMSDELFMNLEVERAQGIGGSSPWHSVVYQQFFNTLDEIVRTAGKVPIAFVIMPDEFQVEEHLWQAVTARTGPLDRDRAQREIVAWAKDRKVPVLDLLPVFRAAPPLADGRLHLFHDQETHTNARGNALAGREVARFIRPLLPRRARVPFTVDFDAQPAEAGWHDAEISEGRTYAWSRGDRSVLEVALPDGQDVDMDVACQPFMFPGAPPQRVSIVLNGKPIEELRLLPRWSRYRVRLPKDALRQPVNHLEFRYAYTRTPKQVTPGSPDTRQLAVAWYSIGFSSDGAQRLVYDGRASDRVRVHGGITMSLDVKGSDAIVAQVRQSDAILKLKELRIDGDGERFVAAANGEGLIFHTRMDRVKATGTYDAAPFEFTFGRSTQLAELGSEPLKQIAYGLALGSRRFSLGRHGEYTQLDESSDAAGEAMGVILDSPVRLPDRPVRVGDSWTAEWRGTRTTPDTGAVFHYTQTAKFDETVDAGASARISFTTKGTLEIPAETNAERLETTTLEAAGTVLFDLVRGQIVGVDTEGAITSNFRKAGFSLVRGFKARYEERQD